MMRLKVLADEIEPPAKSPKSNVLSFDKTVSEEDRTDELSSVTDNAYRLEQLERERQEEERELMQAVEEIARVEAERNAGELKILEYQKIESLEVTDQGHTKEYPDIDYMKSADYTEEENLKTFQSGSKPQNSIQSGTKNYEPDMKIIENEKPQTNETVSIQAPKSPNPHMTEAQKRHTISSVAQ